MDILNSYSFHDNMNSSEFYILDPYQSKYHYQARPTKLFDGDGRLFKETVKHVNVYYEYGMGFSTEYMFLKTMANIVSVDTNATWAEGLSKKMKLYSEYRSVQAKEYSGQSYFEKRIKYEYINIGKVNQWGYPLNLKHRNRFIDYIQSPWVQGGEHLNPDLVLIDGRFRIGCFFACIAYSKPGTLIIFDDYNEREIYHVVEEYFGPPQERCGRQALFATDKRMEQQLALDLMQKYSTLLY